MNQLDEQLFFHNIGTVSYTHLDVYKRQLQGLPIRDLTITEPDLEEVFLHFYEGESR